MNKSRKKTPKAVLEAAFSSYVDNKVSACFALLSELDAAALAGLDKSLFQKTLLLLFIGELFGCHTLNQILTVQMKSSGSWHKRLASLSYQQIELGVCALLKDTALRTLTELGKKSESSWSRSTVSLVIDDSVFKQWLTCGLSDPNTVAFFDRYYSGQSNSTVYGFRITLCGLAIDQTFYPMYFTLTKKTDNTRQTACNLLTLAHKDISLVCKKEKLTLPNLFLSVDSGFHGSELLTLCASFDTTALPVTLVCVPKNNHLVEIKATKSTPFFRGKLPEFIDKYFKVAETVFYEDPANSAEHFTMRLKINYLSVDKQLIILIFRYRKSQKVSVIYTTDLNIKAKTLRHRWFQRTHIEQFFRILKDTLKIQLTKSTDKNGFVKKFCIKLFQALHIQLFRNYCRKKYRYLKNKAFPEIRLLMITNLDTNKIFEKYSI